MSLLKGIVEFATTVISQLGYPGVFLLMMMESMVFPVPSEAVMPFAGFLVATGHFSSLWIVTGVATLGSIAGSLLSYWMGFHWGDSFVTRFGKYLLVTDRDWAMTKRFSRRTGAWSIAFARIVPVVRHLISLPAGATRMPLGQFVGATIVGAFAWNGFLAYLGWKVGENWEAISKRLEPFDLLIFGILTLGAAAYVGTQLVRARKARGRPASPVPDEPTDRT